jgi:lipopolysaccharide export system permease protein
MKVLDRYLIRRFFTYFIVALAAFVLVFLIVDIVENLDRYVDRKANASDVMWFYIYYLPYIIVLVFPVATLLGASFLASSMSKSLEIVALKSSGIPSIRIGRTIYVLGFIISVAAFLIGELVLPISNSKRDNIKREKIYRRRGSRRIINDLYYISDNGSVFYFRSFDFHKGIGFDVIMLRFEDDNLKMRLDGKKMKWSAERWIVENCIIRNFYELGEKIQQLDSYALNIKDTPQDFARKIPRPDELGFIQLRKLISKIEKSGMKPVREKTDLWMKISYPLVNFIILLWGLSLSLKLRRANYLVGFGQSFFIAFIYLAALRAGQAMGYNGRLSPWLGAFSGDIIFFMAGILIVWYNRD